MMVVAETVTTRVTVHRSPVMLVGASLLAIRADGAQHGNFVAPRGIREQARSYPIQATPVNVYLLALLTLNHYSGKITA
jgi:hypothetical protein